MSAEARTSLPRWAEVSRTACKASVYSYATLYMIGFAVHSVHWLRNGGNFWPTTNTNVSWEWYEVVIVSALVGTAVISGLLWLAGEVVSGYREPSG